jgi:hypothetical protein
MTAAEKKAMIKQMQGLMIEIVDLDKDLSDNKTTDLKSPGLPDGIWGKDTDESYKLILAAYNKSDAAPSNMDKAQLFLNKVKTSLIVEKTRAADKKEESEKTNTPAQSQSKPASAITDDEAKAAFRGLLESIQSGRIKLKAGSNTNEFRQRIGRDWGAIIRVYKGPQGVVDAFYGELALTDPEKNQLVKINKDGLDGTSTVVGKINQKFLEAINTYIKPFGRALRTEKGMARVIDRRQERQERKQNKANAALKDLWILSKVAQRKEVARERLVKTAETKTNKYSEFFYQFGREIIDVNSTLNKLQDQPKSAKINQLLQQLKIGGREEMYNFLFAVQNKTIGPNRFGSKNKNDHIYMEDIQILKDSTKYLTSLPSEYPNYWGGFYSKSARALGELISYINNRLSSLEAKANSDSQKYANYTFEEFLSSPGKEAFKKTMKEDVFDWMSKHYDEGRDIIMANAGDYNFRYALNAYLSARSPEREPTPTEVGKTTPTDLTELRNLLAEAGYKIGEGEGWAPLEAPFRAAVEKFANLIGKKLTPPWSWGDVAQQTFGMSPNISGAEQLVSDLIGRQKAAQQAAAGEIPAAAPAPTASTGGPVDKLDVVSGLESLFGQILSKEVKVDQEGADMRRDSKDFRGVIRGLGGAKSAAAYCVEYGGFSLKENKEIIAYKGKTLESLAGKIDRSTVLSKIYTLFTDIRKKSRRPFRRGIREDVLAENVRLWLKGERQEDNTKTSISKSIEIRKAAARKKLGLQS